MHNNKSLLHPDGSVFTIGCSISESKGKVDKGILSIRANDQSYYLSIVEFNDDGSYVSPQQIADACDCIKLARQANEKNGVIVVVFIHGWHHNANWSEDSKNNDVHFQSFREVLNRLTLRECERYNKGAQAGRTVVGIYLGWNGDPVNSFLLKFNLLKHLGFLGRYRTSKKIGGHESIQGAIQKIIESTKGVLKYSHEEESKIYPESPLIMIGHSMGALMLETAFLSLLNNQDIFNSSESLPSSKEETQKRIVETRIDGKLFAFPDLLLAINSAANSKIIREILIVLEKHKFNKEIIIETPKYHPPFLISATSENDSVTKLIWRFAPFNYFSKTDGNDHSLFTHNFKLKETNVKCEPKKGVNDFGQNFHRIRPPEPLSSETPNIDIDLPTRERKGEHDFPPHNRYSLTPIAGNDKAHLNWIFQVPKEIISNHNNIFNSLSSSLMLGLIQISGAIASLAENWEDTFEVE